MLTHETKGVLTPERADNLRQMPLQDCDVLLHEAGAPPIHTPLKVLSELPDEVKKRLYVVHTSALPEGSDLRVAPTGTAGTIRLDQLKPKTRPSYSGGQANRMKVPEEPTQFAVECENDDTADEIASLVSLDALLDNNEVAAEGATDTSQEVYGYKDEYFQGQGSTSNIWDRDSQRRKPRFQPGSLPPMVFLRPTCVSDAWFILNLLSNVPFLSRYVKSECLMLLFFG